MSKISRPSLKPMTELRRRTAEVLEEIRDSRIPVMVTEHGRDAGLIIDPETWHAMVARLELLEELSLGLQALSQGRVHGHKSVKSELKQLLRS
jgi:prevent-host-death family protein